MTLAVTTIIGFIILYCVYNIGFRKGCYTILELFDKANIMEADLLFKKLEDYNNKIRELNER